MAIYDPNNNQHSDGTDAETSSSMLEISYADYKDLKDLYETAVRTDTPSFIFKDQEVLTSFIKYLLEYLSSKFKTL